MIISTPNKIKNAINKNKNFHIPISADFNIQFEKIAKEVPYVVKLNLGKESTELEAPISNATFFGSFTEISNLEKKLMTTTPLIAVRGFDKFFRRVISLTNYLESPLRSETYSISDLLTFAYSFRTSYLTSLITNKYKIEDYLENCLTHPKKDLENLNDQLIQTLPDPEIDDLQSMQLSYWGNSILYFGTPILSAINDMRNIGNAYLGFSILKDIFSYEQELLNQEIETLTGHLLRSNIEDLKEVSSFFDKYRTRFFSLARSAKSAYSKLYEFNSMLKIPFIKDVEEVKSIKDLLTENVLY